MPVLTKLIVDNYYELHKFVQEKEHFSTPKEAEAQSFFAEHRAGMTKEDIMHGLLYVNSSPFFKKNSRVIADNLLRIPDLFQRINDGDFGVLEQVVKAFNIGKCLRISHVQYAMNFCALINPAQFPRFDENVFSLMRADGYDFSQFVHNGIIFDVAGIIEIALLVKSFYDAIKDNTKDSTYTDIHSILTIIWKFLTAPRVIDAAIAGTLNAVLSALGLPPAISAILAKLVSMWLDIYLRP